MLSGSSLWWSHGIFEARLQSVLQLGLCDTRGKPWPAQSTVPSFLYVEDLTWPKHDMYVFRIYPSNKFGNQTLQFTTWRHIKKVRFSVICYKDVWESKVFFRNLRSASIRGLNSPYDRNEGQSKYFANSQHPKINSGNRWDDHLHSQAYDWLSTDWGKLPIKPHSLHLMDVPPRHFAPPACFSEAKIHLVISANSTHITQWRSVFKKGKMKLIKRVLNKFAWNHQEELGTGLWCLKDIKIRNKGIHCQHKSSLKRLNTR